MPAEGAQSAQARQLRRKRTKGQLNSVDVFYQPGVPLSKRSGVTASLRAPVGTEKLRPSSVTSESGVEMTPFEQHGPGEVSLALISICFVFMKLLSSCHGKTCRHLTFRMQILETGLATIFRNRNLRPKASSTQCQLVYCSLDSPTATVVFWPQVVSKSWLLFAHLVINTNPVVWITARLSASDVLKC